MTSVPFPPGTDGAVSSPAPAPEPFRRGSGEFSAGDVRLNGEPSGMQDPVVGTPSSTAGFTTGLSADGDTHIPVVLSEQPSALSFSPGWWVDAPTQLLVLLVLVTAVGLPLAGLLKRELNRSEAEASASGAGRPVPDAETRVSESEPGDHPADPRRDGQHLAVVAGSSVTRTP